MKEVKDEKIKSIIMVCVICLLGVPIALFVAFFFAVDKVYASNMEISWADLSMPQEYIAGYYSANTGGTQTRSTIGITQGPVYTLGNDRKFMIYTFKNSQLYKFIAFAPYEYAFREGEYYTVKIYLRSQGGYPFGTNWGICLGSYSGCVGANRQYGEYYRAESTSFYLYRPKEGATPDEPEWTRVTDVYAYTFVVKAYDDGPWVFYRHNNTYSDNIAFYGYTIEYAGSSFASVTNAIAQQTTTINNNTQNAINNSTTSVNNTTVQQNQQTRDTVEEQEQQTRDTITDSSTDFESPDIDTDTGPISGLLTMPITLARAVNNNSDSCSAFPLGNLLGTNLSMPCIDLEGVLGSTLYNIIDVICCGVFIFTLRKVLVNVYVKVMSLRNINPGEVS